jgi:hypothetical protein
MPQQETFTDVQPVTPIQAAGSKTSNSKETFTDVQPIAPLPQHEEQSTSKPGMLDSADNAITNALKTNPANLGSAAKTNLIEAPKTLGREVYSAGKSLLNMVPGAYHAVTDAPTEDEQKQGFGSAAARLPLIADRMVVKPLDTAADYYSKAAYGQNKDTAGDVLENAPEALGTAAGNVIGGKLIDAGIERAPAAAEATGKLVKAGVEKTGKAGPALLKKGAETIEHATTPKNIAKEAGDLVPIPGVRSLARASSGALAEKLLGTERANTPLIKVPDSIKNFGVEKPGIVSKEPFELKAPDSPEPEQLKLDITKGEAPKSEPLVRAPQESPESPAMEKLKNMKTEPVVRPGVRIGDQNKPLIEAPADEEGPTVAEGHTATPESSSTHSYKTAPDEGELHIAFKKAPDTVHVHGGFSKAELAEFEKAGSKGKAFSKIDKSLHPQVAKIVKGKRTDF